MTSACSIGLEMSTLEAPNTRWRCSGTKPQANVLCSDGILPRSGAASLGVEPRWHSGFPDRRVLREYIEYMLCFGECSAASQLADRLCCTLIDARLECRVFASLLEILAEDMLGAV